MCVCVYMCIVHRKEVVIRYIFRKCLMSSVSTWSLYLRESCNLHIRRRELGGDMIFSAPALKQTLDHIKDTGGNQGFVFFFSTIGTSPHLEHMLLHQLFKCQLQKCI